MMVVQEEYLIKAIKLNNGEEYKNSLSEKVKLDTWINRDFNYYIVEEIESKTFPFPGIKLYRRGMHNVVKDKYIVLDEIYMKEILLSFIPFSSIYSIDFFHIDELSDNQKELIGIEEAKEQIELLDPEDIPLM